MNIFKFDSPVMNFIGKVADLIILNLLTLVLSIPIVTFGAAYTAKYYVSMKIIRGEEGTLLKPYFKSFKENFKQSTIAWLILLVINAVLTVDWLWIVFNKGISNVNNIYLIGTIFITCLAVFTTMTIFPFIARFDLQLKEAFKGAVIFSFLYFFKLLGIAALEVMTVVASLWYGHWLPLILFFGTTTAFYFMNLTMIKGFKKLEAKIEKEEEEKKAKEEAEAEEEESEPLILRPDEHTLKGKFEAEKQTFKGLTFVEKLQFFKDYYLGKTILTILVVAFAIWFLYDAFLGKKEMLYSGGLIYCAISEEGKTYLTDDLLDSLTDNKHKKEVLLSEDMILDFDEEEHDPVADPTQDQAIMAAVIAGYYDYFFVDAHLIEHYEQFECYKDIGEYATLYGIPEEDCYFAAYDEDEIKDDPSLEGKTYINAIKLPDDVCEKLGLRSQSGEGVYLVLCLNDKEKERDDIFMSQIFK